VKPYGATVTNLFFLLLALSADAGAMQCNECHSRNPAMVAMHKAVQAKEIGCFDCHRMGEKLMGKAPAKDRNSLLARRASETVCKECHGTSPFRHCQNKS